MCAAKLFYFIFIVLLYTFICAILSKLLFCELAIILIKAACLGFFATIA